MLMALVQTLGNNGVGVVHVASAHVGGARWTPLGQLKQIAVKTKQNAWIFCEFPLTKYVATSNSLQASKKHPGIPSIAELRWMLFAFVSTFSVKVFKVSRILPTSSSTLRRLLSTSKRKADAMSRTVLMEASMSSFMSFQAVISVLASNFAWVLWACSPISSESCWHRSWTSCKLWETSSIQASWAFKASCISPISKRIVEISAVTVACKTTVFFFGFHILLDLA